MSRTDQKFILAQYQYVPVDTCIVKLSRRIPLSANCLLYCRYKVIVRERLKWYDVYRSKSNLFFFLSLFFIRSLFILDWPNPLDFQFDGGGICMLLPFFRFISGKGAGRGVGVTAPINSAWAVPCVNTTRLKKKEKKSAPKFYIARRSPKETQKSQNLTSLINC